MRHQFPLIARLVKRLRPGGFISSHRAFIFPLTGRYAISIVVATDFQSMSDTMMEFKVGDIVYKTSGDYTFQGAIVASFQKRSGAWRYVVENIDGVLHIFSGKQLDAVPEKRRVGL